MASSEATVETKPEESIRKQESFGYSDHLPLWIPAWMRVPKVKHSCITTSGDKLFSDAAASTNLTPTNTPTDSYQ